MGGFDSATLKSVLGLPSNQFPVALLALGKQVEGIDENENHPKLRYSHDDIIRYIS